MHPFTAELMPAAPPHCKLSKTSKSTAVVTAWDGLGLLAPDMTMANGAWEVLKSC